MNNYDAFDLNGRRVYLSQNFIDEIANIDAIIFDVDGVLIDSRNSYDKTIQKTVLYIANKYPEFNLPQYDISEEIIYAFRNTGGFNSDWDTSYVILLGLLSFSLRNYLYLDSKPELSSIKYDSVDKYLLELASFADHRGIVSVEEQLSSLSGDFTDEFSKFKRLLNYPGDISTSLLVKAFDEFFLGVNYFKNTRGLNLEINNQRGLIENESTIVSNYTLKWLAENIGDTKLGIASGRGSKTTAITLGPLFNYFNSNAVVFLEDEVLNSSSNTSDEPEKGKPAPYSLLKSSKSFEDSNSILFIGDSAEDLIMSQNARKIDNRFNFAGVYGSSSNHDVRVDFFLKNNCDIGLYSVNDLPLILSGELGDGT